MCLLIQRDVKGQSIQVDALQRDKIKRYVSQLAPGKNPITYFRGGLLAAQVSDRCDGNK